MVFLYSRRKNLKFDMNVDGIIRLRIFLSDFDDSIPVAEAKGNKKNRFPLSADAIRSSAVHLFMEMVHSITMNVLKM
jgi:hypothetical protein